MPKIEMFLQNYKLTQNRADPVKQIGVDLATTVPDFCWYGVFCSKNEKLNSFKKES